jgi:hypothetical protein
MPTIKPTIDDQNADLEATITDLNRQWAPLARVQPQSLSSFQNPLQYAPERLIQKQEIGLQIDEAHVELAHLKAQQARATLAAMQDRLAQAEVEERETRAARVAAEQAFQEANAAWANANGALNHFREQQRIHEQTAASEERAAKRWSDERARDQQILTEARDVQQRQANFRAARDREQAA